MRIVFPPYEYPDEVEKVLANPDSFSAELQPRPKTKTAPIAESRTNTGVTYRDRTDDLWDHNPMLYQLS